MTDGSKLGPIAIAGTHATHIVTHLEAFSYSPDAVPPLLAGPILPTCMVSICLRLHSFWLIQSRLELNRHIVGHHLALFQLPRLLLLNIKNMPPPRGYTYIRTMNIFIFITILNILSPTPLAMSNKHLKRCTNPMVLYSQLKSFMIHCYCVMQDNQEISHHAAMGFENASPS
jgi:hypothetical protein